MRALGLPLLVLLICPPLGAQLSGLYVPPHDLSVGTEPQGEHLTPATLTQPAVGGVVTDPVFNTKIRRLPDNHSHVYSQLQSFSHDNTYMILIDHAQGYHVRRVADLSVVSNSAGWYSAYRWIPGTHKIVILEGDPVTFRQFDCDTGQWSILLRLTPYKYASGSRSYEELSHDGKWTAVYINNAGDGSQRIISVNLAEKRIGFDRTLQDLGALDPTWGLLEPDWVGVSPLGKYVLIQWVRDSSIPASGLELYDIETGAFVRRLYTHHNHSDLGVSEDNREYVATTEMSSPIDGNYPGLVVHWLDGSPVLHLRPVPWGRTEHLSCQGPNGVILISAGGEFDGAYKNELYAAYLDGSLRRLVHHRSSAGDYWVQPKASLSRNGKLAIWSSDWGQSGALGAYMLQDLELGNLEPTIDSAAWAVPSVVRLPTPVSVHVVAGDLDGDALVYTWSKEGGPGTVSFAPNGTAQSDESTATFSAAGTYVLRVTVADGQGGSASSDVTVWVNPASGGAGDLNGDDVVNIEDLALVATHFGQTVVDPDWNALADANGDCIVNVTDLTEVTSNFGKTY